VLQSTVISSGLDLGVNQPSISPRCVNQPSISPRCVNQRAVPSPRSRPPLLGLPLSATSSWPPALGHLFLASRSRPPILGLPFSASHSRPQSAQSGLRRAPSAGQMGFMSQSSLRHPASEHRVGEKTVVV
jgi:hypothetical protein